MLRSTYISVSKEAIIEYAKRTSRHFNSKTASESSYYDEFKRFLENIFPPNKGYMIQIAPKIPGSSNHPDIVVLFDNVVLFYIEAKPPTSDLDELMALHKKTRLKEQIYKYREEGAQLLITNFLEVGVIDNAIPNDIKTKQQFRFRCKLLNKKENKFIPNDEAATSLQTLLTWTCENYLITVQNIKKLIRPLASIATRIRNKAIKLLIDKDLSEKFESGMVNEQELKYARKYLFSIKNDFHKSIFKEEVGDPNELISDLYAQTLIYGAFSGWVKFNQSKQQLNKNIKNTINHNSMHNNNPNSRIDNDISSDYSLKLVSELLPIGSFLREFFLDIKQRAPSIFHKELEELEFRLKNTEFLAVTHNVESFITTFYSDFLKEYDPVLTKERGVVYTPHEIVEFIVEGIDFLLKRWFEKPDGIITLNSSEFVDSKNGSNHKEGANVRKSVNLNKNSNLSKLILSDSNEPIQILDPAAGTMAFASGLLHVAKKKFEFKYLKSPELAQQGFENWVKKTFFPNMFAFEILMAPYVLGHIRIFLTLEQLGVKLSQKNYKLNSYLMNTLMTPPTQKKMDKWLFQNQDIGDHIKEALSVRDKNPIFIVMGNPPYNLSSQNNCKWINNKINDYKKDLNERNLKILSDDYVKFIRFAQWKITEVGSGIVALITNNRYLEGQVFSVMRKSLRKTFDHIYIVNLHGDMRKKESGNPFNIRVGVAIALMVRIDNSPNKNAAIHYMDVPNQDKLEKFAILSDGFKEEKFRLLPETSKNYFVPFDVSLMDHYERFITIDKFFKSKTKSGIMVGRDRLLMDVDKDVVKKHLRLFFNRDFEKLNELKIQIKDTKSWKVEKVLTNSSYDKAIHSITRLQYRGMDWRYFAYEPNIVEGPRMGFIDQISPDNPAITVTKSSRKKEFCTAFISECPIEKCYMSVTDTAFAFPLYFKGEFNIHSKLYSTNSGFKVDSKDLFYYIYAIMHSKLYRTRYKPYLLRGYPRIPITKSATLFNLMSEYGLELANAHLLHVELLDTISISPTHIDNWKITKIDYDVSSETIYLQKRPKKNKWPKNIPWIKGISREVWEYTIGSIKQLEQFLKSRRYSDIPKKNHLTRSLNHDEIMYFLRMCSGITKAIEIEKKIDSIYEQIDILEDSK